MKVTRSSEMSLKFATRSKRDVLDIFFSEYQRVTNQYIQLFWENPPEERADIVKEILDQVTDSWLTSRARQVSAREALGMVRSAKALKGSMPVHSGKSVLATVSIAELQRGRNSFDFWLKIHSIGRKIVLYLPLKDHRHNQKYADWKQCTTFVIKRDSLKVSYQIVTEGKKAVGLQRGIDIGLNKLIALNTGETYGEDLKPLIQKLFRKKRCSNAWYRCLAEIKAYINVTLKRLPWDQFRLVVVENLRNMKRGMKNGVKKAKHFRRRLNSSIRRVLTHWNYRYVLERIESFCQLNRVSFRTVSPFNTSITCSQCNHCEKSNRVSQERFVCRNCGYASDADVNAAKNILGRLLTGKYGSCFQP